MPTLNEEEGVGECIERAKTAIAELGMRAEIILSDSSTDRTPEIGREMGAVVVEPDGKGYGYAYRYAFDRARGDYIVMGDADTTYDFEQIPRLLEHLREEDADMVMGSRLEGEIKPGAMPPLHQHIGNPLLTKFLNAFYGAGVSDAHSGFRIFTRDAYETMNLQTTGMEFASEMIMEAGAKDLEIVETPIVYHEREGEETLESFKDGWRHVRFMLVNAPGYLFSVPGALLSVFGLAIMAIAASSVTIGGINLGIHSMIAGSLFTIVGYQVASLGVFATVASDPIRKPRDPITERVTESLSLERGATFGLGIFALGGGYASLLVYQWISSGFSSIAFTMGSLAAFTAIVLGFQTVFSSFFLSAVNQ
nr:glycosyltransferase family 2 protein [Halosolutus gelatinilyticus]